MKKYNIIYADPAWSFKESVWQSYRPSNMGKPRHINQFYKTMTLLEMCKIPVNNLCNKDCALFLWTTNSHIDEAITLIDNWGFKFKTTAFVWVKKSNKGKTLSNIGAWTMGNTELCLFATKGNMLKYKKDNTIKQLIEAERTKHSKKPNEARLRIEKLFGDLPRLELFARENYEGWDAWGNEVEKSINI